MSGLTERTQVQTERLKYKHQVNYIQSVGKDQWPGDPREGSLRSLGAPHTHTRSALVLQHAPRKNSPHCSVKHSRLGIQERLKGRAQGNLFTNKKSKPGLQ